MADLGIDIRGRPLAGLTEQLGGLVYAGQTGLDQGLELHEFAAHHLGGQGSWIRDDLGRDVSMRGHQRGAGHLTIPTITLARPAMAASPPKM